MKQVHGAQWVVVEEHSFPSSFEETQADALLTQRKGVYLGVKVADCLPVIFFDPEREALALLHAGWRGIIQGIHLRVAQAMKNLFSSSYSQLVVGIGPGIGKCCFSVGEEVAGAFEQRERRGGNVDRKEGRFLINLKGFLFDELVDQGFDPHKVEVAPHCTFCEKELFYSPSERRRGSGKIYASCFFKRRMVMNLEEGIVARHLLVEIIGSASLNEKETMEKFLQDLAQGLWQ